jgi:hypothetical protein
MLALPINGVSVAQYYSYQPILDYSLPQHLDLASLQSLSQTQYSPVFQASGNWGYDSLPLGNQIYLDSNGDVVFAYHQELQGLLLANKVANSVS